jgi:hypothetical protein
MVDGKALANELQQARAARIEAETACGDVEELLWEVRQGPRIWRRLALVGAEAKAEPLH